MLSAIKNPSLTLALADCYAARGEWVEALYYYRKRASLDGQAAQTWYALYRTACMLDELGFDSQQVIEAYHHAYDFRPTKIEPLVRIARRCRLEGKLQTGLDITLTSLETGQVDREYFFEPNSWGVERLLEYLRINLALNCFTQVITTSEHLLANGQMPLDALKQVKVLYDNALKKRASHPEQDQTDSSLQADQAPVVERRGYLPGPIPAATESRKRRKLCIGMSTFDDYDGVYFSVQAIRMYHPEVLDQIEILVIDNNPTGPGAVSLKALDGAIENYRYVPRAEAVSSFAKDYIFQEANADFVLVMDYHVFLEPGVVRQLLDYLEANPDCNDLLQGPLIYDDLKSISTHFEPGWSGGMWGKWQTDERGENPLADSFDIPMQGCGLFVCRHAAWPGFNPRFRSFGAEEGYIHEKIRQAGGRTLCLPLYAFDGIYYYPQSGQELSTVEAEAGYLERLQIANRVIHQKPVVESEDSSSQRLLTYRHIINKLRQSRAASVLIMEQLPDLENGLSESLGEQVSELTSGVCGYFCIQHDSPVKTIAAVAIHRRIFDQVLASLPDTQEASTLVMTPSHTRVVQNEYGCYNLFSPTSPRRIGRWPAQTNSADS